MDNKKTNITQILVLLGLAFAAFYFGSSIKNKNSNVKQPDDSSIGSNSQQVVAPTVDLTVVKSAFNDALIKFGDDTSKLVLLEISDPSCPYCNIAAGYNGELNSQAGAQFKLVADGGTYVSPVQEMEKLAQSGEASFAMIYMNGHGAGEMAMKSLYCAYEVGKFWEASALIFNGDGYDLVNNVVRNDSTKSGDLADFLSSAVDRDVMKSCLDSGKYDEQLVKDSGIASTLGVTGTPGFFVNENKYSGAYSYTDMEPAVNTILGR